MKLKKLLKHTDFCENVIIYVNEDDEPIYRGSCLNIPWSLIDLPLNSEGSNGAVYTKVENGKGYIEIYLKEE